MSVHRSEAAVPEAAWFKSSYSTGGGGECVEVAAATDAVLIRDSKQLRGAVMGVGAEAWAEFVMMASDH